MSDRETNVEGSPHSGWTHCNWLQHVFVLIRAEGIDPGTGSDLSGGEVSNVGSMDSHNIASY